MVVFVVVVYKQEASRSKTVRSLGSGLVATGRDDWHVLIVDNSETAADPPVGIAHCTYLHTGRNLGLARSYNRALEFCREHGAEVLVTLDQDSEVTLDYLNEVFERSAELDGNVVVLCPRVSCAGRLISPYTVDSLGRRRFGTIEGRATAINSFAVYSVPFLLSIGGFDEHYWLDALDFDTFSRIRAHGGRVGLLQAVVPHELSVLGRSISPQRLENIAYYETCFLLERERIVPMVSGLIRLAARVLRHWPEGSRASGLRRLARAMAAGAAAGRRRRSRRMEAREK